MAKRMKIERLAQYVSNNKKDDAVPLLLDDATPKVMVKLKRVITTQNVFSLSVDTILAVTLQEVIETK